MKYKQQNIFKAVKEGTAQWIKKSNLEYILEIWKLTQNLSKRRHKKEKQKRFQNIAIQSKNIELTKSVC